MTWESAQNATSTRDCSVPGCTGIAYRKDSDLCQWHFSHGTPDQYRSRKVQPTQERIDALQERLDDLDRQIGRLMEERRRVYRRYSRLLGEGV